MIKKIHNKKNMKKGKGKEKKKLHQPRMDNQKSLTHI